MIGSLSPDKNISIFGSGIAGLTMAYRLKQLNLDFKIYEKNNIGGKIVSRLTPWGPLESAASTLYMNRASEEFIKELNLPYFKAQPKLRRLIALPQKSLSLPTPGIIASLGLRAFQRFPSISDSSTVAEILGPLFGKNGTDEILSSLFQGIYTAEACELHFLSLFPWAKNKSFKNYFHFLKVMMNEMKKGSSREIKGSISFPNGMQTLVERLRIEIGERIMHGSLEYQPHNNNIICTNAPDASKILKEHEPEVAGLLEEIEYRPVTSYAFFLQDELPELIQSYGILIPQKFKSSILGIIHQSAVFPQNYKANCYTVICKGILDKTAVHNELINQNLSFNHERILEDSLTSWAQGLPLYDLKRYRAINQLQKLLKERPGLMLFGNYTNGIGLRSMIEQTRQFP